MPANDLAADSKRKAAEVCKDVALEEAAKKLLRDTHNTKQFLDLLVEKEMYIDAMKVLARALPKRQAVEWAIACVKPEAGTTPEATAALQAAEAWVAQPTEPNRVAAMKAAEADGHDSPGGLAAAAAGWSGGSFVPDSKKPAPPPDHLTAQAVIGAIALVLVKDPEKMGDRQVEFLEKGLGFAKKAAPAAPEPAYKPPWARS